MSRTSYLQDRLFTGPSIPVAAEFKSVDGLFLDDDEEFSLSVTTIERTAESLEEGSSTMSNSESPISFSHSRSPTLEVAPDSPQGEHGFVTVLKTTSSCSQTTLTNDKEIEAFFADQRKGLQSLYISQENSWSPLDITLTAFRSLTQGATIFAAIQNSVIFLGSRNLEVEVAPPPLQSRLLQGGSARQDPCGCELSYGLRFIEQGHREDFRPWSLRQCAIYNKTDFAVDLSRWLFISIPDVIREPIDHYLDKFGEEAARNPFDIHCLLLNAVIGMWRPYLVYLTRKVDKHTKDLLLAKPDGKGHYSLINGRESQALKSLDDELLDAMLAIDATKDTAMRLLTIYCTLNQTSSKAKHIQGSNSFDPIMHSLNEKQNDAQLLLTQLTTLRSKLDSTTKAVANMVNLSMAQQTHQDTQAVKALTVIALIFLPTTVVLNFFSASFIDVRGDEIVLIGKWWLFIVIGVPLTVIILLAWRLWVEFKWSDVVASKVALQDKLQQGIGKLRMRRHRTAAESNNEKDCMV